MLKKEATGEARKLEKWKKMEGEITMCPPRPEENEGEGPPPKETDEMKEDEGGEATHNLQSSRSAHQVKKCSTKKHKHSTQICPGMEGEIPTPPRGRQDIYGHHQSERA